MKKLIANGLITAFAFAAVVDTTTKIANDITNETLKELKSNLKTQIKTNGFPKALKYCAHNAYSIVYNISKKYPNATIKRVTLKPRNPLDKADKNDEIVLNMFEKNKNLKEIVLKKENKTLIYKPIYISKQVCLKCHGENIDSKIKSEIHTYYPNDKATGYKLGDLRGAFKIEISKNN